MLALLSVLVLSASTVLTQPPIAHLELSLGLSLMGNDHGGVGMNCIEPQSFKTGKSNGLNHNHFKRTGKPATSKYASFAALATRWLARPSQSR
jgi:hypothetical protein